MAQTAPNIGFEDGNFSYWQCYIGKVDSLGVVNVNPSPPTPGRQTLYSKKIDAKVKDYYGNFSVVCPNGSNYSIQLGDNGLGALAERVSYTLTVPVGITYSVIFDYAVVLQNPNHLAFQQPRFTVRVFDITDNVYISCPSFDFIAGGNLPGFKYDAADQVYYKDWSSATVDLSNYPGKSMRIEFTANGCTLGGHFGYAYLDVNDNIGSAISGNSYCTGQTSVTLSAPNGFAAYNWYNADFTKQVGTGQVLKISPAPPDQTKYALQILPYDGLGCIDTLYTVINKINEGFNLNVLDTIKTCPGSVVDLTDAAVTAGSSSGMTLSYYTDSLGTNYLQNPDYITDTGVYYIRGVNADGCTNILPVNVVLNVPVIKVTDPQPAVYPATVDLSKTYTAINSQTYSYFSNAACTEPLNDFTAINATGTFYIKAVSSSGCIVIMPVNVVVLPPVPYSLIAPNTFTPNNDGINDYFTISVKGVVTFERINIYNRYGLLVFTTNSLTGYWDGNYNGHNAPTGTYYWLFEGNDGYYHKEVRQGGSITLLR